MYLKNLPTLDEIVFFLKDNIKIIITTTVLFFSLFLLGIGYTIYTDSKIDENTNILEEQEVKLSELNQDMPFEAQLEPEEIKLIMKNLQKDGGMAFSFYMENDLGEPFLANSLMNELLTSEDVLKKVEEEAGTSIDPSPELAVQVTLNPNTQVMTLKVGTGDTKKNQLIADAYFNMISSEDSSFFDNKTVYVVTEPEVIKSYEIESDSIPNSDLDINVEERFSYKKIILYTAIALIISIFGGIFIALIRNLLKKEVTDIYGFAFKDNDTILNISNNKYQNKNEKYDQMIHAILHPERDSKLILSEEELDSYIVEKLMDISNIKTNKNQNSILFSSSVSSVNPTLSFDEVIIICKKHSTTKKWYETQRELLKIYKSEIKVILI
ncbi:hypothetical protein [Carnobacterium inhibens]|uniref:Uncharacterized protein n=1 Tax=Carnobacterium inhibens subsp. gilichinskyi TaxID=1266845 RepID=U5SDM5_9LACT|nr:hypothetical protein [Carnobacterium inhibens]AGY81972.1 hypothetical protein Q783_07090 [Carnobacterium inhibens subsp. gilichinskyi]